jgi:hypothetical protein
MSKKQPMGLIFLEDLNFRGPRFLKGRIGARDGADRAVVENVIRVFELRNVEARMDAIEKAYSGNLGEN